MRLISVWELNLIHSNSKELSLTRIEAISKESINSYVEKLFIIGGANISTYFDKLDIIS